MLSMNLDTSHRRLVRDDVIWLIDQVSVPWGTGETGFRPQA